MDMPPVGEGMRGVFLPPVERKKKVGHYVLEGTLGVGSVCRVRLALHTLAREQVAVKVVSKRALVTNDGARRSFRRETSVLQRLEHPNVARLLEAMETPNSYYLVTELAQGGQLLHRVAQRQVLGEEEARHYFTQLVSAVDHIHHSGVIHRNIKLENILLDGDNNVKLIGLGHSALCTEDTALTSQCGSPAYAAPEMFSNRKCGPLIDVWSMGVCLYAMVVGRLPFLTDYLPSISQLHTIIQRGVTLPTFLSPPLRDLLGRMLEPLESKRVSMEEIVRHPWLRKGQGRGVRRYPVVGRAPPHTVDLQIVAYIMQCLDLPETQILSSIGHRKLNAEGALYLLLTKQRREGRLDPAIASSIIPPDLPPAPLHSAHLHPPHSLSPRRPTQREVPQKSAKTNEESIAQSNCFLESEVTQWAENDDVIINDDDAIQIVSEVNGLHDVNGNIHGRGVLRLNLHEDGNEDQGDEEEDRERGIEEDTREGADENGEGEGDPMHYKTCIMCLRESRSLGQGGQGGQLEGGGQEPGGQGKSPRGPLHPRIISYTEPGQRMPHLLPLHHPNASPRQQPPPTLLSKSAGRTKDGDGVHAEGKEGEGRDERGEGAVTWSDAYSAPGGPRPRPPPPPPPPNTADGLRSSTVSGAGLGDQARSLAMLRDPYASMSWAGLQRGGGKGVVREGVAGGEGGGRKGPSFVQSLSSPKTLSTRQARNASFAILRKISHDNNKCSRTSTSSVGSGGSSNSSTDRKCEAAHYGDMDDASENLHNIIRVTITTSK